MIEYQPETTNLFLFTLTFDTKWCDLSFIILNIHNVGIKVSIILKLESQKFNNPSYVACQSSVNDNVIAKSLLFPSSWILIKSFFE